MGTCVQYYNPPPASIERGFSGSQSSRCTVVVSEQSNRAGGYREYKMIVRVRVTCGEFIEPLVDPCQSNS